MAVLTELSGQLDTAARHYLEIRDAAMAMVDVRNGWRMWAQGLGLGARCW